jgi:hypothetical protein
MIREGDGAHGSRAAVLLLALAAATGISSAVAGWYYRKQMYFEYQAGEQRFRSVATSYLGVNDEARLIREYFPYLHNLHRCGVLGLELRLDWIELLLSADRRPGLMSLHYRIGVRTVYKSPPHFINNGGYRIYYSPMHIDMDLLHEEYLYKFFADLDRRQLGIYNVASCTLSKLHDKINRERAEGNIRVQCDLLWFNIRKQDGAAVDLS